MKRRLANILNGIYAALVATGLASCEKVIDVQLNAAERKYVIEGIVTDEPGMARVLISQTADFDESSRFVGVSGATVTVTEDGGTTTTFTEGAQGIYEAPLLAGSSNKQYALTVSINGQVFSAIASMPAKVNLDTIFVTDEFLFTETRKIVNVEYQDPPGTGNNYRFIQYVNQYREDQIMIQNDEYTDGRRVNNKLFFFTEDDDDVHNIRSGDNITIEMLCIDPKIYKYWYSLDRSSTGTSGQATPANPVSNMQGGALGYFSAHTIQRKTMVVP